MCTFVCTVADILNVYVLLNAERRVPHLPTCCKKQFCKRNEKTGRKWLKNVNVVIKKFQLQPLKVFTVKSEEFHSESVAQSFFFLKSMNPLCIPFSIILQVFTIETKWTSLFYNTNTRKY